MNLPIDFVQRMRMVLGADADSFFESYDHTPVAGLRLNPLKVNRQDFAVHSPFQLRPIPWAPCGYYYESEERPGKHPYHEAGLYYIQEPSAMAVAQIVDPKPGECVLDLCAAPGGKTTQLAAMMNNQGLLVSNEIHPTRAKVLSQNVERLGLANTVVTNEPPDRLAKHFSFFFDRILVDAPCSGEGMFRKDPDTCEQWSLSHVQMCSERQLLILDQIKDMLKPGGRLVYSTCTFSHEENEQVVEAFLKDHPDFHLEEVDTYEEFCSELPGTYRLWPHQISGEGHFVAVFRRDEFVHRAKHRVQKGLQGKNLLQEYDDFAKRNLNGQRKGTMVLFGEHLYCVPEQMVTMEKLKVVRPGLHLGTMKTNRFEPSHAYALAMKPEEAVQTFDLSGADRRTEAYLKGEALAGDGYKNGWVLVTVDGYSLGWVKAADDILKNHYPKGLRWK